MSFTAKNILIIVGDFTEDYEVMVPYQALTMVGHNIHVVCPGKKSGDFIATSVHDGEKSLQTYTEKRGHNFILNKDWDTLDLAYYHGVILPGGRAPEYLRNDQKVLDVVEYFLKNNVLVGAIGHGIQLMLPSPLVKGRKLTTHLTAIIEIKMSGAIYDESKDKLEDVLVDGNIITGVAWHSTPYFLREFLKALGTEVVSKF